MNVLFHHYEFPPHGWGIGAYMANMAKALKAEGHKTVVVTGRAEGCPEQEETESGTIYRCYEKHEIGSDRVRDRVLALAREHEVDLIEGADHHGDCASILRYSPRPPVMIKAQSSNALSVLTESQILHRWQWLTVKAAHLRARRQIRAERYSLEHADVLCLSSNRMLHELRKQGVRIPEQVGVLPNPIDALGTFFEEEASMPTILMVGRLDIGKGIQYLPSIMEHVLCQRPEAVLEMVGGDAYARGLGSLRRWLEAKLGSSATSVRFHGRVPAADLDAAYKRAWVVIVPSRWDNFPTVVLEAMARGKAVVASPNGGMPEMLGDTLCPIADPATPQFADRVCELLGDEERRKAAGTSALQRAEAAYHPSAVAKQYVEFVGRYI